MSTQTEYFLGIDGQRRGPFSLEELRAQNVVATSLIWRKGLATWTKAEDLSELRTEMIGGPPPLPPPSSSVVPAAAAVTSLKQPWNPRTIAWLSIACSPLWGGFMTAANAKRLGVTNASMRPIGIGFGWIVIGIVLNLWLGEGCFRSVGLYLGSIWALWFMDLREQARLYEASRAPNANEGSWVVPGLVGAPFAILAFCAMVIGPFVPLEPREVCRRLVDADSDAEIKRYATLNLQPALIALNKADEKDDDSAYELLGEEATTDSTGHLVGYRSSTTDKGKTVTIEGFFHLLPVDGDWKVEEMYVTAAGGQAWDDPVPISVNYQDILQAHRAEQAAKKTPEFLAHHGSLSKEAREKAEQRMHGEKPTTLLCTSTLELGIDVGRVKVVGQLGPAWSVASLVQRLGRSGRRPGDRPGIQLYLQHYEGADSTNLIAPLVPDLLQAVAMMELLRERWMESPPAGEFDLSTFVHQILAIIKEAGGILPADLYPRLLDSGMFNAIDEQTFVAVLRSLKQKDAIDQISTGELILGTAGERLASHYEFYSVFLTPLEYEVKHERESIGTIPAVAVPLVKDHLILANRRWRVEGVDAERLTIQVTPSKARKPPKFLGAAGEIDTRIRREMRTVLLADRDYDYLNSTARAWLAEARGEAAGYGLRSGNVVSLGSERQCWFTWTGTRAQRTLIAAARRAGIEAADEKVAIVLKCSPDNLREFAAEFVRHTPTAEHLAAELPCKQMRKFDRFLSDELLILSLARNCFDIEESKRVASMILM